MISVPILRVSTCRRSLPAPRVSTSRTVLATFPSSGASDLQWPSIPVPVILHSPSAMSRVSGGNLDPRSSDRELERHGAVASRFVSVFLALQRIFFSRFSFLSCRVCLQAGFVLRGLDFNSSVEEGNYDGSFVSVW